jgi:hypothetical protein
MRLPIVRGRDFDERDRTRAEAVVIVNQRLVDQHFPGEAAVGQRIQVRRGSNPPWRRIVGVVANAVQQSLTDVPREEVYLPLPQAPEFVEGTGVAASYLTYVVRTSDRPESALGEVRGAVKAVAPAAAISDVFLMTDVVDRATAGSGFLLAVIGSFASVALVLAAVGIYGVFSYGVELRRREFGIRLALGASPRGIAGRILGEGLLVTAAGGVVGLGLAVLSARLLSRLLFGVTPFDVPALAGATAGLVAAAAIGCLLPARRASRIEPRVELR